MHTLAVAKCISQFVQKRPRRVLAFWLFTNSLLFVGCLCVEMLDSSAANNATKTSLTQIDDFRIDGAKWKGHEWEVRVSSLLPSMMAAAAMLALLTRSLPVVFAASLATLQVACTANITRRWRVVGGSPTSLVVLLAVVATSNAIAVRKSWEKSRRGPSESTISRLVVSCVDKTLPFGVALTMAATLQPLAAVAGDPLHSLPAAATFAACALLANLCSQTTVLAVLLVRHECNLSCPSSPGGIVRLLQAFVDEKLVYLAHFVCQVGQKLLSSPLKIPLVVFYVLSLLVYATRLCLLAVRAGMSKSAAQCAYPQCWSGLSVNAAMFIVPTFLLVAINRLQSHTFIGLISISFSMSAFHLTKVTLSPELVLSPLQYMLLSLVPIDSALRYCMAYRCSRKKQHSAKVLDALDTVFSQLTVPGVAAIGAAAVGTFWLDASRALLAPLGVLFAASWFSAVVFTSAALILCGIWSSCGHVRRESQQSESRSLYTDKMSSHIIVDPQDYTRRYSSANYYGTGNNNNGGKQKRSFCMNPTDTRRASMPVIVQQKVVQKQWAEGSGRCRSIDGPATVRVIAKRETLLQSRGSLASDRVILEEM